MSTIAAITPAVPLGPPRDHQIKWSLPPHIRYRVISPRNVQLIAGLNPRGCVACHAEVQERHLISYRGHRHCPACFAARAAQDRAEVNAVLSRPTFAARARAYVERAGLRDEVVPDTNLAWQNVPEEVP